MDELDLEKIEEELNQISVFPWDGIVKYSTAVKRDISFISKATERIATLVSELKKVREDLEHYKMLNDMKDRRISSLIRDIFELQNKFIKLKDGAKL